MKLLVNSTYIHQHAGLLETRHRLPLLIRKLVQQTVPNLQQNQFRTDEGIQLGGWDGLVETDQATAYVPFGKSGWELGATDKVKGKADKDYEERKRTTDSVDAAETTFAFVTPRRWGGRDKWVAARRKEKFWKNVIALDADDLSGWLETAPGVHIWLSSEMGKYPGGVTDLTTWWEDWLAETAGHVTGEMLLAGRDETVRQISEWLRGGGSYFALQAATRNEAIAVLLAAVQALPDAERATWVDRIVIVRNLDAWRQLATQENGLLLVPEFSGPLEENAGGALRRHRVFLPLDAASAQERDTKSVAPVQARRLREILENIGTRQPESDTLASLGRRSFTEFRRHFLVAPAAASAPWAEGAAGQTLLPALLIGAWDDGNPADQAAVAHVAGMDYQNYRELLLNWSHTPAPPVREVAGAWFVIDKGGAWERLQRIAPSVVLDRFGEIATLVLGPNAPRIEAQPDDNFIRQRLVGQRQHSGRLRHAIADTLALLGADDAPDKVADKTQGILRDLFRTANSSEDGSGWAAIGGSIRLLAEAAPDLFLTAVLTDLASATPALIALFQEREELLIPSSDHAGLLWALEALAWNPDFLPDAALALAQLARLDPGGKLLNRPANSLREIFLIWHPQTMADSADRFAVLDQLRRAESGIAWPLLVRLLPKHHDVGGQNAMPRWRWRDWQTQQHGPMSWDRLFQDYAQLTTRVLEDAGQDIRRWATLIDPLAQWLRYVSPEQLKQILSGLEEAARVEAPEEQREVIRKELQDLLARYRRSRSTPNEFALPAEMLDRLESVYEALQPPDVVERSAWVFTQWPQLPAGRSGGGHEEGVRETEAAQDAALADIYQAEGLEGVLRVAERAPEPFYVGRTAMRTPWGRDVVADWLTRFLASTEGWEGNFAEGLAAGVVLDAFKSEESRIAAESFGLAQAAHWRPAQIARYFSRLPTDPRTWQQVESLGAEAAVAYWQWVWPWGIATPDVETAVQHLLEQHRPVSALDVLYYEVYSGTRPAATIVLEALEALLRDGTEHDRIKRNQSYQLEQLLDYLDEAPDLDSIRTLQVTFLLSRVFSYGTVPKVIARELSRNPRLFVEMHELVYKGRNEEERPPVEMGSLQFMQWERAYDILAHWNTLPGTQNDAQGTVDTAAAEEWIQQARALAATVNRVEICEENVGKLIAHTNAGADGIWPQEAICELIERLDLDNVVHGTDVGRFNIHGSTHRVDGGLREEGIAEVYRTAAQARRKFYRTARLLRQLAKTFEGAAKRERAEEDLREQTE